GVAGDLSVALRDALLAIDHEQRDVCALEPTTRHHHAEFFSDQVGLALAANAGGVDEAINAAVPTDFDIYGVHGCARHGRDDGAFFANHAIEQGGFADIGASNNGDLYGAGFF